MLHLMSWDPKHELLVLAAQYHGHPVHEIISINLIEIIVLICKRLFNFAVEYLTHMAFKKKIHNMVKCLKSSKVEKY